MRAFIALALVAGFGCQVDKAVAFACNNNHYVNSSGHLVHSPSCGREPLHHAADCRDGSISYSEHYHGTCSHDGGVAHWD
jgi:hypothetical protein